MEESWDWGVGAGGSEPPAMLGADEDTILYLHLDTRKQSPIGTPTTDAVTHVHQGDPSHRSQEGERRAAQPPE